MNTEENNTDINQLNVRKTLNKLRQRWQNHSPISPIFLEEELESGLTISKFCVNFLITQRNRRVRPDLKESE